MRSRTIIGALSIVLFSKQFVSINKLTFDYHNNAIDEDAVNYKKGTYILSFKYFQHVLNKYQNPKVGDLVIFQQPDKTLKFKIVEAVPQTYFCEIEGGMHYYVPNGFVVLRDPSNDLIKMEFIANVKGIDHYALTL